MSELDPLREDALLAEIEADRRAEHRLLLVSGVAALVTAAVVVLSWLGR